MGIRPAAGVGGSAATASRENVYDTIARAAMTPTVNNANDEDDNIRYKARKKR